MTKANRPERAREDLPLEQLDLGHLAFFAGQRMNEVVLAKLHASGYEGVRISHGYVVQHLIGGDRSVTELGKLMAVSQQAASKVIAELGRLGYVENVPAGDARLRRVRLSARGRAMLERTRKIRGQVEKALLRGFSPEKLGQARLVLLTLLRRLGGVEALRQRRVREPRDRSL